MRKIVVLCLFCFFSVSLFSQDLSVESKKDSISSSEDSIKKKSEKKEITYTFGYSNQELIQNGIFFEVTPFKHLHLGGTISFFYFPVVEVYAKLGIGSYDTWDLGIKASKMFFIADENENEDSFIYSSSLYFATTFNENAFISVSGGALFYKGEPRDHFSEFIIPWFEFCIGVAF